MQEVQNQELSGLRNKVQGKPPVRLWKAAGEEIWEGVIYYPKGGRVIGKVRLFAEIAFEPSSIET